MARSTNGSTEVIRCGTPTALGSAANATFATWVFRSALGTTAGAGTKGNGANVHKFDFVWFSDDVLYCFASAASTAFGLVTKAVTGWHHIILLYDGSQSTDATRFRVMFDGVIQTLSFVGTIPATLGTATEMCFGIDYVSGERFWAGQYAEGGLWNATLTDNEGVSLSRGILPYKIRKSNLIGYWPLNGILSPEPDLHLGTYNGILTGTARTNHPPVSLFSKSATAETIPTTPSITPEPFYASIIG